ncbi:hypothetical protein LWI28_026759 [Acer negundo]|uniref:Uncharacterized protein n=1 Tax=Acer negundo TaxID=4023 RepID=A0AAD5NXW0_ACENE|nr:hypothetical protein LWI28_026759 [Acer negundo]KAK4852807.1 hypothetical protein QYF36_027207 [Acer negundo]
MAVPVFHCGKCVIVACSSSNALPLVSGIRYAMITTDEAQMPVKMKNDPKPAVLHSIIKLKVYETAQALDPLTIVARLPAEPFTFIGNI